MLKPGFWSALRDLADETLDFLFTYVLPQDAVGPPGLPVVVSHREIVGMSTLQYAYVVSPPALSAEEQAQQVGSLKLYASVDGVAFGPYPVKIGETHEVVVNDGAAVELYFTAVDEAGNESAPGPALQFTAVDDIPPTAPGAPVVLSHTEITVESSESSDNGDEPPVVPPVIPPVIPPVFPPVVPPPAPPESSDNGDLPPAPPV